MTDKLTLGLHHVGLTVPDLDEAQRFFCDVLGWDIVGGNPDYPAVFVSDGRAVLTLWRIADRKTAIAFDRRANVGLHHLALTVRDDTALDAVHERVRGSPGAEIEFAPTAMRSGSATRHFICVMPGGVRIEFATPFA